MPTSRLPTYHIGSASRLTGLSEHLIRVWERRYGAVRPERAKSRVRLYSERDLDRLRLLKRATERGHAVSSIAALANDQLERIAGGPAPGPAGGEPEKVTAKKHVEAVLKAVARFDLIGAEEAIVRADAVLGLRVTAINVLLPMLREVGERWEKGELSVAHEHAAAAVVRNHLGSAVRDLGRESDAALAIVTTPPGELHEFGALVAASYAASFGIRAAYLGPNLPNADLVSAAQALRARWVLLSAVAGRRGLRTGLAEVRRQLPAKVEIIVGGRAAERLSDMSPGVVRLDSIEQLGPLLSGMDRAQR